MYLYMYVRLIGIGRLRTDFLFTLRAGRAISGSNNTPAIGIPTLFF